MHSNGRCKNLNNYRKNPQITAPMYITLGNKTTLRGILCYKSNSQNGCRENASLRTIQTIFLLTPIYKDFFTVNFVAVQLPLMPSYSIKENVLHHYYLSNTNSAFIQDPNLIVIIQQPLGFPLYNSLLHT